MVTIVTQPAERRVSVDPANVGYYLVTLPVVSFLYNISESVGSLTNADVGDGYHSFPTISFSGGGGSGATAVVSSMQVTSGIPFSGSTTTDANYAPNDTITLTGGTFSQAAVYTVATTSIKPNPNISIANAGSGGTPGGVVLTGVSGTGTKFQLNATIGSDGTLSNLVSLITAGSYTVNPSTPASTAVSGGGLTGATLHVTMQPATVNVTTAGSYTVLPTQPVNQGSSSGSGTGCNFDVGFGLLTNNLTSGGSGYITAPTVTVTRIDGFGAGAAITAVLAGTGDTFTVNVDFVPPLPNTDYTVFATLNAAAVVSFGEKTTSTVPVIITPLNGDTLISGSLDIEVIYTN